MNKNDTVNSQKLMKNKTEIKRYISLKNYKYKQNNGVNSVGKDEKGTKGKQLRRKKRNSDDILVFSFNLKNLRSLHSDARTPQL